jgi:hypothetical protein
MATSHDEHAAEDTAIVYAGFGSEAKILGAKILPELDRDLHSCLWRSHSGPIHVIHFKLNLRRDEGSLLRTSGVRLHRQILDPRRT